MHEIICPHCSKAFKIDEAGYADILKQVRDGAFEQQLHERLELAEQDKRNAVELAQAQVASEMQKTAVAKDSEIQALKAKLDAGEVARKLAVTEALRNSIGSGLAMQHENAFPSDPMHPTLFTLGYEGLTIKPFTARLQAAGLPQAHPQPIQGGWQLANLHAGFFEVHPDARCVIA